MESELNLIKRCITYNKINIEKSTECTCIDCFCIFQPEDITIFAKESHFDMTGICSHCMNDTLIPNNLFQYTLDDLKRFHKLYLSTPFDENITDFKHMSKESLNTTSYDYHIKTHTRNNIMNVKRSVNCTCLYCMKTFPAKEVVKYNYNITAVCPYCDVDAILPDYFVKYSEDQLKKFRAMKF